MTNWHACIADIYSIPVHQLSRVLFHGIMLSVIIMGFWLLDSLKDPILELFIGMAFQPSAKIISVCTTLVLVCIYDYMTSILSKSSLFHSVSIIFGVLFMILSALVSDPNYGLANRVKGTHRFVGWLVNINLNYYQY